MQQQSASGPADGQPESVYVTTGGAYPSLDLSGGQPPPPPTPFSPHGGGKGTGKGGEGNDRYSVRVPVETPSWDGVSKSWQKYRDEVKWWRKLARGRLPPEDQATVLLLNLDDHPQEVASEGSGGQDLGAVQRLYGWRAQ